MGEASLFPRKLSGIKPLKSSHISRIEPTSFGGAPIAVALTRTSACERLALFHPERRELCRGSCIDDYWLPERIHRFLDLLVGLDDVHVLCDVSLRWMRQPQVSGELVDYARQTWADVDRLIWEEWHLKGASADTASSDAKDVQATPDLRHVGTA